MRALAALVVLLAAAPALGEKSELFGTGKPPSFREEAIDRKFTRSRLARLLDQGSTEPGCVQLLGGLFVALAELAPSLHKRDENFRLDPVLVDALDTQLSTPRFPAAAYLVAMVRRVMIDRRLPDAWLATAQAVNRVVKIIDVPRLKMLNEGLVLADSADFTIPRLRELYVKEALGANSAVTTDVLATFRDTYLDREVSWGGAMLVDVGLNQPKGKRKRRYALAEPEELIAVLSWQPPDPRKTELDLLGQHPVKVDPIIIYARLNARQYVDVETLHRGQRVLVKGRLWEMNRTLTEIEVRDALLFGDIDWGRGALLASPEAIDACPAAINELTGLAPVQPGGFAH